MLEQLAPEILKYGGPGLVIVGLGWVIRALWTAYTAVQEKRIGEYQAMTVKMVDALNANTTSNMANAQAFNGLSEIIKAMGRTKE